MTRLLLVLGLALPQGLDSDDAVALGEGAGFYGMELPEEVGIGEETPFRVYFRTGTDLEDDVYAFIHIQSRDGDCRLVRDERPIPDAEGLVAHEFRLTLPESEACAPQAMEVYTGLYNRRTRERFRVKGISTRDDRIPAGHFDLVEGKSSAPRAVTPSAMQRYRFWSHLLPFRWWFAGLALSILLAVGLRWRSAKRQGGDA